MYSGGIATQPFAERSYWLAVLVVLPFSYVHVHVVVGRGFVFVLVYVPSDSAFVVVVVVVVAFVRALRHSSTAFTNTISYRRYNMI